MPAGALKASAGGRISWGQFETALGEIGWHHVDLDVWEPGSREDRAAGRLRHIRRNFYVGVD